MQQNLWYNISVRGERSRRKERNIDKNIQQGEKTQLRVGYKRDEVEAGDDGGIGRNREDTEDTRGMTCDLSARHSADERA